MMYSCLICSAALNHAQPKYGEIELKSNTDVPHPYFFRPPKKNLLYIVSDTLVYTEYFILNCTMYYEWCRQEPNILNCLLYLPTHL